MSKPTILMIESDLPTIALYREALRQDYEMLSCSDESSALEVMATRSLHAIILEPAMGGGRGWRIFAAINTNTREHLVPIILCTTSDDRKRGLEMGATAFLVKPVLPSLLLVTVRQFQPSRPPG